MGYDLLLSNQKMCYLLNPSPTWSNITQWVEFKNNKSHQENPITAAIRYIYRSYQIPWVSSFKPSYCYALFREYRVTLHEALTFEPSGWIQRTDSTTIMKMHYMFTSIHYIYWLYNISLIIMLSYAYGTEGTSILYPAGG